MTAKPQSRWDCSSPLSFPVSSSYLLMVTKWLMTVLICPPSASLLNGKDTDFASVQLGMCLSRIHSIFVIQMMSSGKQMATIMWACIWSYPEQNWSVTPNTSRTHLHHCQVGSDRDYTSLHCPLHPDVSWSPGAQAQALPSCMDPYSPKEWSHLIFTLLI